MEIHLLKIVLDRLLPPMDAGATGHHPELLALARCTAGLQSEPAAMAEDALAGARAFRDLEPMLTEIGQKASALERLTPADWWTLGCLATLQRMLTELWDDWYLPIFEHDAALGEEFENVRAFLGTVPFPAALAALENQWNVDDGSAEFESAALICLTACGRAGVFGSEGLCARAASCLDFRRDFLVVVLAGHCFKVDGIASRVAIETWPDGRYECMRLLDTFAQSGESAWG